MEASPQPASSRARLAIALGAAVVLAAIVVVVAVASGGSDDERAAVAAPTRCVEAWNADKAARAYGRHNFSFHLYKGALVTFLTTDGAEVGGGEGGLCAVIFPSEALDPEPFAAGQVLDGRRWKAISELAGVELTRVAELQVMAAGSPNTTLDIRGVLAPL
jgi:hypothetical protein